MKRKLSIVCIILGGVLLAGALFLFLWNEYEAKQAEEASDKLLVQLIDKIQEQTTSPNPRPSITVPPVTTNSPEISKPVPNPTVTDTPSIEQDTPIETPNTPIEMSEIEIDGHTYIGYVTISKLGLELPIMSSWDYDKLKISPCRYAGTVQEENLVLMAHNYKRHFGTIYKLTIGDRVSFTDVNGVITVYEVVSIDTLQPTSVEKVLSGEYDLTLFTCTYGGKTRVTVYCDMVNR